MEGLRKQLPHSISQIYLVESPSSAQRKRWVAKLQVKFQVSLSSHDLSYRATYGFISK